MISILMPTEQVRLDPECVTALGTRFGTIAADELVSETVSDLGILLAQAKQAYRGGRLAQLARATREIKVLARRIGLTGLHDVADQLDDLCHGSDGASLAASSARMIRVGDASLVEICHAADMTL